MYCLSIKIILLLPFRMPEDHSMVQSNVSSVDRLHATISRAHHYLNQARLRGSASSVMDEVNLRFPQSQVTSFKRSKRKKMKCWKVVPVCLQNHSLSRVPTKGKLANLCKIGLGSKWFCTEDKLAIELYLTKEELHFLIVCLYHQLHDVPYELCKATGPGNCVIVPLNIDDPSKKPRRGRPFVPHFSCEKVKELIGRKGKLYIRPLESIPPDRCPTMSEVSVSFSPLRCPFHTPTNVYI